MSVFKEDEHGHRIAINFNKGTTTLGFKFSGGVVIAVDSRASGGQFISMLIHVFSFILEIIFFLNYYLIIAIPHKIITFKTCDDFKLAFKFYHTIMIIVTKY